MSKGDEYGPEYHRRRVGELRQLRVHNCWRGARRAEERQRTNDYVRFHLAELRRCQTPSFRAPVATDALESQAITVLPMLHQLALMF